MLNLFDDTELFGSGKPGVRKFDLPDTDLILNQGFFDKNEADYYYNFLLNRTPWREADLTVYNKTHIIPRMVAWYEDKDNFGANPEGNNWSPQLLAIRNKVEEATGITFNSVLLNLYRNGSDGVGWHSDRKTSAGENAIIASVSFGETRVFKMRHKFRKDIPQVEIPLQHGAFLLMAGTTQSFWQHQVSKTAKHVLPRINLTFRIVKRDTL